MINMEFTKAYILSYCEGEVELVFLNESDRNEMALAFWQEGTYEGFMWEYTQYGEFFKENNLKPYLACHSPEEALKMMWADRLTLCQTNAFEHLWTYDTTIVEG